MKKFLAIAICTALLAFAGTARAESFAISNIAITPTGNTENFTWAVSPATGYTIFDLTVGFSTTFKYGSFSTGIFGNDDYDYSYYYDNDDMSQANFIVNASGFFSELSHVASPTVNGNLSYIPLHGWHIYNKSVTVDYDNTPLIVSFGNGGSYSVTFLDPETLYSNISVDLKATITLLSASQASPDPDPQAVPEPVSILLLSLGIFGIAGVRRLRG